MDGWMVERRQKTSTDRPTDQKKAWKPHMHTHAQRSAAQRSAQDRTD